MTEMAHIEQTENHVLEIKDFLKKSWEQNQPLTTSRIPVKEPKKEIVEMKLKPGLKPLLVSPS